MSKKHFIALANAIREHNRIEGNKIGFGDPSAKLFDKAHLDTLASFCEDQNTNFKRDRWLNYIRGDCGPNGGIIRSVAEALPA